MKDKILAALKTSDRTAGELKDICGCGYSELFTELEKLVQASEIEHFMGGEPIALRYRLGLFRPASSWTLLPRKSD
ncbi:hypothetical protein NIES4101_53370 [Calothrix sp. NIES-4101]|nr:hypothetical protein NIES4101_53370 [Calothrix sp. NIES-4101]